MLQLDVDFKELKKSLELVGSRKHLRKQVNLALLAVAKEMRRDSNRNLPIDTKELYDSWVEELDGDDLLAGYDIIYAMYQHQGRRQDGTHIIVNRPAGGKTYFLKLAIDQNFRRYINTFEETLFKELYR